MPESSLCVSAQGEIVGGGCAVRGTCEREVSSWLQGRILGRGHESAVVLISLCALQRKELGETPGMGRRGNEGMPRMIHEQEVRWESGGPEEGDAAEWAKEKRKKTDGGRTWMYTTEGGNWRPGLTQSLGGHCALLIPYGGM